MLECVVLGAKSYDFKNDSGERVKGVRVTYVDPDEYEESDAVMGFTPATITCDIDLFKDFGKLPAVCQLKIGTRASKAGGKPTLYIKQVKRIKDFQHFHHLQQAK